MATTRPRPTPELIAELHEGKRALHQEQRELSLPEKVAQVLALQRIDYEIRKNRRDLEVWEKPWNVEP